ncbi:glycosyltransferase [Acinetobacter tianfuensis]|uniref:Glycosyltransferase family 1 protein n=1 Tax=Acinetobacter tianfuensis TaxID=2419603 RepID=A0A3A8EBU0_9GAMM|nr:glycosyltransferase [Acinetobacter tianfuensis]RKG31598.1 glycosyltransferase family 1 protein [Acinetobacter tianfuensis]
MKFIKSFFKIVRNWYFNRTVSNYYGTNFKKNVLISYITLPFYKNYVSHTNSFEALTAAKIFNELGYNVDILFYKNKINDLKKYDVIYGFGDVFEQVVKKNLNPTLIYYGTGMHVCHQNMKTLERMHDVHQKKDVWLPKSMRYVRESWSYQTTIAHAIIALGNEVCEKSYRKHTDISKIYSLRAPYFHTIKNNLIYERKESSKNKFLWFGSSGLIHKGLDLCLEYFKLNKTVELHICGNILSEPDFVKVYYEELYRTKNIFTYGFIDINSEKFKEILLTCSFIIFPSCSEGGSPSVVTCVGNGGLIPIVTKETSFSTGYEIIIDNYSLKGIEDAIHSVTSLNFEKIKALQEYNQQFVLKNNSQDKYLKDMRMIINNIIEPTMDGCANVSNL